MKRGYATIKCQECRKEFIAPAARKYCDECQEKLWYTCTDCGGSKSYKYSKWCYQCSLKHRDTSKYSENIKKAVEAAQAPEVRARMRESLMGHPVSEETRRKIGAANVASGHLQENGRRVGLAGRGKKKSKSFVLAMSKRMSGAGNPMWKGGSSKSKYAHGWFDTLKEAIRERDEWKCRLCGKTTEENGRALDVHHIDETKTNHSLDNLVSLCKSCHHLITSGSIEDPFKSSRFIQEMGLLTDEAEYGEEGEDDDTD